MSKNNTLNADLIADYFLYKGQRANAPITNKKLQKLLYYAQAWSLVIRDSKLFKEKIEAWVHGPAVRDIYIEYKHFGFSPIVKNINTTEIEKIPLETKNFLNEIWRIYGRYDAGYLEQLTHSEHPWQEARESLQDFENSENIISLKTMKDFYTDKLKQTRKNAKK